MGNNEIVKTYDGKLVVPDVPTIPFIEGDGIGPDVWRATQMVLDSAVNAAYEGERKIGRLELLAGEKGYEKTGEWLSANVLETIKALVVLGCLARC